MGRLRHEDLEPAFRSVQRDEDGSFAAFYDLVSRGVFAYCYSFTGDLDAAQDLLQQCMLILYEQRQRFSSGDLVAWIFTIARNVCRTWQRQDGRTISMNATEELRLFVTERPSEDAGQLYDPDEHAALHWAILELSEEFRLVIILHYFAGLSTEEIAETEQISAVLVRVRLFRARQRLHTLLTPLLRDAS